MLDPYNLKPKLFCWMAVGAMGLGAYLILLACGYVPLFWPFARAQWCLLAGGSAVVWGASLFRNGDPRKAYAQPGRFLSRPGAPEGEREALANFYRAYKDQAQRGLLIGEQWIVYSSLTQTFAYPRASLRQVAKEITVSPDSEGGNNVTKCLVLHFEGSEPYVGKGGHSIRSYEGQIDRWIAYIRAQCADVPVAYVNLQYDTRNFARKK